VVTVVPRMKRLVAVPVAALVAACLPIPGPPPPPYKAIGTEPFWNVLIDEHHVTFIQPDAEPIRQPRPQEISGIAGETYQTPRITVNIVHSPGCSDGMSDRVYPDRVQVMVDGRRFNGCGGL
jgi:uncharacterized membrane protein